MKANFRLILFCILQLLLLPVVNAQFIAGMFRSGNAQKLSHSLTDGLGSNTAKVRAIHDWITHNIKYDVKKLDKLNLSWVPVKKVLHQRKAICTGYSALFNEMCSATGIRSVSVPGYVKEIHVDIMDNFYLDEHMWNAVNVNGEWKLVDACWDAGYVDFCNKNLLWRLSHFLSGGKHDRFKPHFVRYPVHIYFCRQGKFFKNDHLALNPCWQLLNPVISIKKFKEDSAYYFKRYDTQFDRSPVSRNDEESRQSYYDMDESNRIIADGFSGTRFNFRNQFRLGLAQEEIAENKSKQLNPASKDTDSHDR